MQRTLGAAFKRLAVPAGAAAYAHDSLEAELAHVNKEECGAFEDEALFAQRQNAAAAAVRVKWAAMGGAAAPTAGDAQTLQTIISDALGLELDTFDRIMTTRARGSFGDPFAPYGTGAARVREVAARYTFWPLQGGAAASLFLRVHCPLHALDGDSK